MARLLTVGWETNDPTIEIGGAGTGTFSTSTTNVRSGTYAFRTNPTAATGYITPEYKTAGTANNDYLRLYLYIATGVSADATAIALFRSATSGNIVSLRLNTNNTLELWNEQTSAQLGSDSSALSLNTWYRIELEYRRSAATGHAYINGTQFATGTVANTYTTELARFGVIDTTTADLYWDDLAVNDSTGTDQTGLPGDGKLVRWFPTGAGDNAATLGTFADIDEVTPDDATTFIDLDAATTIADYVGTSSVAMGIGATDEIKLVDVGIRMREEANAVSSYQMRIKSASGGTVSSSVAVDGGSTTWRTNPNSTVRILNRHVAYTDPTTGNPWTPTGTNSITNMQLGVASLTTSDIDVSTLWGYIEYVPAPTDISFDAASNIAYQTGSTYNWNHTCSGGNRYLVVSISMLSVAGSTVSSITYDGVAMSLIRAKSSAVGAVRVETWGLVNPNPGTNSIAVTLSASLASVGGAASFQGVHQTTSTEGATDASATNVGAADATVDVTTVADNDWVIDAVATDDTAITVGAGQTSRWNATGALGSGAGSTEGPKTPAGTVTMSWTNVAALATWTTVALALRPASASDATTTSTSSTSASTSISTSSTSTSRSTSTSSTSSSISTSSTSQSTSTSRSTSTSSTSQSTSTSVSTSSTSSSISTSSTSSSISTSSTSSSISTSTSISTSSTSQSTSTSISTSSTSSSISTSSTSRSTSTSSTSSSISTSISTSSTSQSTSLSTSSSTSSTSSSTSLSTSSTSSSISTSSTSISISTSSTSASTSRSTSTSSTSQSTSISISTSSTSASTSRSTSSTSSSVSTSISTSSTSQSTSQSTSISTSSTSSSTSLSTSSTSSSTSLSTSSTSSSVSTSVSTSSTSMSTSTTTTVPATTTSTSSTSSSTSVSTSTSSTSTSISTSISTSSTSRSISTSSTSSSISTSTTLIDINSMPRAHIPPTSMRFRIINRRMSFK